ncbi:hypothetical protein PAAG_01961 [Paracoccidioides lutzii Pb01]|uniref:Carbohydrate kinase PfkB domain-containing protein n=1 Tax=Paracoccidioides lutzii (strain ATCC MYA-826 / Pb01) TaxID=502779 RepID=C1GTW6_PARBA|nr:hypothetical protein PAAG_01961 [Paracoccidioides lutzii Pb01]EEH39772.2 hypothetical protein PAAG_01961 [Paracoccidioides lutzii Pb01]
MRALVTIGACYLDTILTVDHYPGEDEKLRASSISRRRGGNTLNTLEVLQQLLESRSQNAQAAEGDGHTNINGDNSRNDVDNTPPLYAVAVLPAKSSPAIREIKASFGPDVDLQHLIYREECSEPASSYIIKSTSTGTRTIVNYNELPEMTVAEFVRIAESLSTATTPPGRPRWFHFEGRIPDVTLECIRYIRQKFPADKVSVEVEKPGRSGLQELAAVADVVFYSKTWAQANGYQSPSDFLQWQAPLTPEASILCCTWGDRGAACLDTRSMSYIHCPAYIDLRSPVVVDTIGAGDTFIAGMLYGLIYHGDDSDFSLQLILDFANRLAAYKVMQEGFEGLGEAVAKSL